MAAPFFAVMKFFPKWKYHREQEARVVNDAAAEAALGAGWVDSPALFDAASGSQDEPLRLPVSIDPAPSKTKGKRR